MKQDKLEPTHPLINFSNLDPSEVLRKPTQHGYTPLQVDLKHNFLPFLRPILLDCLISY